MDLSLLNHVDNFGDTVFLRILDVGYTCNNESDGKTMRILKFILSTGYDINIKNNNPHLGEPPVMKPDGHFDEITCWTTFLYDNGASLTDTNANGDNLFIRSVNFLKKILIMNHFQHLILCFQKINH